MFQVNSLMRAGSTGLTTRTRVAAIASTTGGTKVADLGGHVDPSGNHQYQCGDGQAARQGQVRL